MSLYLHSVVKPSKILGTQEDCMGISNLYMLTLKRIGGMCMPKELFSRKWVLSLMSCV